ncbi:MAG: ribonuclease HI, partial [bacterium]|nr:ribonuclease HI [bacterium]
MAKTKKKFYAIANGRKPGIYDKWFGDDGAQAQVQGYPGARYQGFFTLKEAQEWLENPHQPRAEKTAKPRTHTSGTEIDTNKELQKGTIIIYTDGGCINNPGPGGYGAVIFSGDKRKELSGGYRLTTNNRM